MLNIGQSEFRKQTCWVWSLQVTENIGQIPSWVSESARWMILKFKSSLWQPIPYDTAKSCKLTGNTTSSLPGRNYFSLKVLCLQLDWVCCSHTASWFLWSFVVHNPLMPVLCHNGNVEQSTHWGGTVLKGDRGRAWVVFPQNCSKFHSNFFQGVSKLNFFL